VTPFLEGEEKVAAPCPEQHMIRHGINPDKVVLWYDVVDCHLFNDPSLIDIFESNHYSPGSVALFQDDFVLVYDIVAIMMESLQDPQTPYRQTDFENHLRVLAILDDYTPICRRIFEQKETASNDNRKGVLSPLMPEDS